MISYEPGVGINLERNDLKIKLEISKPRIYEIDDHHYFEFDLEETVEKKVVSMDKNTQMDIMVPNINYIVANKLGLPPLFKNMYDGCLLVLRSDVDKVSNLIENIDDWSELAKTRISKTLKSLEGKGSTLYRELSKTGKISKMRQRIEEILTNLNQ